MMLSLSLSLSVKSGSSMNARRPLRRQCGLGCCSALLSPRLGLRSSRVRASLRWARDHWGQARDRGVRCPPCGTVRRVASGCGDRRAGNRTDAQSRDAHIGQLAAAQRVQLFGGSEILSVVGEALAQACENARLLDLGGGGVQIDGVSHGRFPLVGSAAGSGARLPTRFRIALIRQID